MIWATVSSRSCFCWLYRASPSSATKNIINLILVLTIQSCPYRVVLCVVGKECAMTSGFSWQNSVRLCPASFCTPRPNLPVTPGISWHLTFHSSPLEWKGHLILVLTVRWCPRVVFSSIVGRVCCSDQCVLLAKLYEPLPCFILYSRAKFRLKLKKVGKITRLFRYDLNQIRYDYTVSRTSFHSSSGTLSIRSRLLNLFLTSTV